MTDQLTYNQFIYYNSMEELDSFDSYYRNVVFNKKNLIIPYVNLGVSEHPLNEEVKLKFIDLSYIVFIDVKYLKVYQERELVATDMEMPSLYFGGANLDDKSFFWDMEIKCEKAFLQILDVSRLSEKMWIPVSNAELKKNLDDKLTEEFFGGKKMPTNIKKLI